jgi:hypothetical protein
VYATEGSGTVRYVAIATRPALSSTSVLGADLRAAAL